MSEPDEPTRAWSLEGDDRGGPDQEPDETPPAGIGAAGAEEQPAGGGQEPTQFLPPVPPGGPPPGGPGPPPGPPGPPGGPPGPPGPPVPEENPNRTMMWVVAGLVVVLLALLAVLLLTRKSGHSSSTAATTVPPSTSTSTSTSASTSTSTSTTASTTTTTATTTTTVPAGGNRPPTPGERAALTSVAAQDYPAYQVSLIRIADSDNSWAALRYQPDDPQTAQGFSEVRHLVGGTWQSVSKGTAQVACTPEVPPNVQADFADILGAC